MSFSVVVATFGDRHLWEPLANRAVLSAEIQTVAPTDVIHIHGENLAAARNEGAERARGHHLVFLDADDELDPLYIEAMTASRSRSDPGSFLFQPATLGVYPDGSEDEFAVMIPRRPLDTGNFMVIGTAVEREMFHRVGGFKDWPIYEDWDLWIRCHRAGAGFVAVPEAIYRVSVTPTSRNHQARDTQVRYFNEIRSRHFS